MIQLYTEDSAKRKLSKLSPYPIDLAWHENRATYLSSRKDRGRLKLRLHRLFLSAPSPVLEAVLGYALKGDKKSGVVIRQMAHLYFSEAKAPAQKLKVRGEVYDLSRIFKRVKKTYFSPELEIAIGWSEKVRVGKFRCMTFGTYDRHRNQIQINPLLDDDQVPEYFLEFIVYHEMLHAICPPKINEKGAVYSHTAEFRRLEKQFRAYDDAIAWEKKSLDFFKRRKRAKHGRS